MFPFSVSDFETLPKMWGLGLSVTILEFVFRIRDIHHHRVIRLIFNLKRIGVIATTTKEW